MEFPVPAKHKAKLKESEKKDKSLDLARELKKLSNMKVTVIPIIFIALGTVTKGLFKGLEDLEIRTRLVTIQTIFTTPPPARAGYDTRSIFKRSLTGLNSEFSFS